LLGNPLVGGMSGDEDVNGAEEQIMHHGEITGPDVESVEYFV
jgi:hypothetical protein